jgi:CRP/FNR family transcriptional regulator
MGIRAFFERAPSLVGAPPELLDRMAAASSVRTYDRHDRIWRAGDAPQSIILLKSGLVKVVRSAGRGRNAICGLFGPPDSVGDLAVLRSMPYPADAIVATERACVVAIPAAFVREGMGKSPDLAVSLACSVHSKLVALHDKVDILSAGSVEARLALLLIKLYGQFGDDFDDDTSEIPVALSRRELAELVSTSFETAIRVMTRWERDGVVETTERGFVIRRMSALAEVAGVEAPT